MSGVGVDVGDPFGWGGDGMEMLLLREAVEPAGAEDLHIEPVGGPTVAVASLEL